ncbi:MAG: reverse transcriptase-like protein [Caldilineaceae bacterium]|nr:reverse transcriptase-like protein [Caldilineaceae bacterium]
MDATQQSDIEQIVEMVRLLAPAQRRLLQRRLQVSGLWDTETLLTDQNRLRIAPALGGQFPVAPVASPASPASTLESPPPVQGRPAAAADAEYHSPIRGHLVVAAASSDEADAPTTPDPHQMMPLPGQAPEQPIQIVFDGGSQGNPGRGYGSFAIDWPGQPQQIIRPQFGDNVTNNEAEYDTLIAALETVLRKLSDQGIVANSAKVQIRGDSLLVINQVLDKWKCNEDRLRVRRDRARSLLSRFGASQLIHHGRENSVRVLGH